ncbi:MAG: electron transport complex subunit RsxC [Candidatus Aureabacteria bacterium]|nr:electron transport complex subunit RsxC [Candidatus Auribacterota bacterium]
MEEDIVMRLGTFRGGIHPPERKGMTKDCPIRRAALPPVVRIPLVQNAGEPPRFMVSAGQHVRTGEKIAEASGPVSVPLHASISGTITRIENVPVPYGGVGLAAEIEGDGKDERVWGSVAGGDPSALSREEIVARIRDAGVVGLGGAEFPAHFKLSPPPEKKLEWVIINGAECEPFLTADHRLMLEMPGDVIAGTRLIMRAAGVERAFIGIEDNKRDAYETIREASAAMPDITPVLLRVKYPQGAEKQLISAIVKREVPPGGLPADVGVVVQNVGTAVAVWEACSAGKPLVERVITVSGQGVREPANWLVRIGTPFKDIIEQSGGLTPDAAVLIMGGPMMGVAQWTTDVPVVKGTSGIIALPECAASETKPRACLRCGLCLRVCPMGLSPALIRQAAEKGRWDLAEQYGIAECMECGACAYVCTTSKNQIQLYKRAKLELKKRGSHVS